MSEVDDYVDALDHILRVARASRTQTRRLRWIAHRASCALDGGDWRDAAYPKMAGGFSFLDDSLRSDNAFVEAVEKVSRSVEANDITLGEGIDLVRAAVEKYLVPALESDQVEEPPHST